MNQGKSTVAVTATTASATMFLGRMKHSNIATFNSEINPVFRTPLSAFDKHYPVVDKKNPFIGYFFHQNDQNSIELPTTIEPITSPFRPNPSAQTSKLNEWVQANNQMSTKHAKLSIANTSRKAVSGTSSNVLLPQHTIKRSTSLNIYLPSNEPSQLIAENTESNDVVFNPASIIGDNSLLVSRYERDFCEIGPLGKGGQGSVYEVMSKIDQARYAIKKISIQTSKRNHDKLIAQALREVRLMANIPSHPNLVRYHASWIDNNVDEDGFNIKGQSNSVENNNSTLHADNFKLKTPHPQPYSLIHHLKNRLSEIDESFRSLSKQSLYSQNDSQDCGFEFEYSNNNSLSINVDNDEGKIGTNMRSKPVKRNSFLKKTITENLNLTLYIQMELCSKAEDPSAHNNPKTPSQTFNLTSWLRSTAEERMTSDEKHLEAMHFFTDIVRGVQHMHKYGVIHRDLKPDNIFIQDQSAKIGDFGLSKSIFSNDDYDANFDQQFIQQTMQNEMDIQHTTALGTFLYGSPEQINSNTSLSTAKYSEKSDIYALGIILLELCCSFSTMMERVQVLTGVRHGVIPPLAQLKYPKEMQLVTSMTSINPIERPSASDVLSQCLSFASPKAPNNVSELNELQMKLMQAMRQIRERSQATLQMEALLNDFALKLQDL